MQKHLVFLFFICFVLSVQSQSSTITQDSVKIKNDSIGKTEFLKQLGNGFFPTKFLNIDMRYLIKFNQYEGIRTGLGGVTNDRFSKRYKVNSYVVYGFRDHTFKYSIGGGFRVNPESNTWINLSYTDDLQETGSSTFLTDKRFFSFFEPRLLNIDLFHRHITKAISIEHELAKTLLSETQFSVSNINPTYAYNYALGNDIINEFHLSMAKISLQWSPFSIFEFKKDQVIEIEDGFPKFTLQYTKAFKDVLGSNLGFSKIDFRALHRIPFNNQSLFEATLTTGLAYGDTPITHLYHAYPNNITKETIMQRFSVAGINSFETMYFNEFFSDRFATLQLKHYLSPFKISPRFKPQLVLISRFAIGDMNNIERHQNISFGKLNHGYSESGFEINKLLFGFGLSFAYRYGAYHLPKQEDNVAFKFTFNVTL